MTTNMAELIITLDMREAEMIRRDLDDIRTAHPELVAFNSMLAKLHHIVGVYGEKHLE